MKIHFFETNCTSFKDDPMTEFLKPVGVGIYFTFYNTNINLDRNDRNSNDVSENSDNANDSNYNTSTDLFFL